MPARVSSAQLTNIWATGVESPHVDTFVRAAPLPDDPDHPELIPPIPVGGALIGAFRSVHAHRCALLCSPARRTRFAIRRRSVEDTTADTHRLEDHAICFACAERHVSVPASRELARTLRAAIERRRDSDGPALLERSQFLNIRPGTVTFSPSFRVSAVSNTSATTTFNIPGGPRPARDLAARVHEAAHIHNGEYSVLWTDQRGAEHSRAFLIHTVQSGGLAGLRVIKQMVHGGWRAFAFLNRDGSLGLWVRYREDAEEEYVHHAEELLRVLRASPNATTPPAWSVPVFDGAAAWSPIEDSTTPTNVRIQTHDWRTERLTCAECNVRVTAHRYCDDHGDPDLERAGSTAERYGTIRTRSPGGRLGTPTLDAEAFRASMQQATNAPRFADIPGGPDPRARDPRARRGTTRRVPVVLMSELGTGEEL